MNEPLSEAQALRALAQRLMTQPHPGGTTATELFVGALPDSLEIDVPHPSAAVLLGSRLKRLAGRPASMDAIYDGDGDPGAVVAAYVEVLRARGWTDFDQFGHGPRGGFFSGGRRAGASLWLHEQPPALTVSATDREGSPTEVRVHLDWESLRQLHALPSGPRQRRPGEGLLPSLRVPPGVVVDGQSGGGGQAHWSMEAAVETERSARSLEAHFAEQLMDAGWTRITGGPADETTAWSSWDLPGDSEWRGLLMVLAAFGPSQRQLIIRIQRRGAGDDGYSGYRVLS